MNATRRSALQLVLASGFYSVFSRPSLATSAESQSGLQADYRLGNGLRLHCYRNSSKYVSAALVLRSCEILNHSGLAHILEHTSFTGAAGNYSAKDLKRRHRTFIQDSSATTSPGRLEWYASFLPRYASEAIELLAITSLDQKCDIGTVESEARVVLQELLLDKHSGDGEIRRRFNAALYGIDHPYGLDSLDAEIAKVSIPASELAKELKEYANLIRQPANMDLVLVGDVEPLEICKLAEQSFGRYPRAQGPVLELPRAHPTRAYRSFEGLSGELGRPLSEIRIGWNTGVTVNDPEARVLLALGDYMNDVIFSEVREKYGDAYSPEAHYEPDGCSGIFTIAATTSKGSEVVEQRIFSTIERLKTHIDPLELSLHKERWELKRLKTAESNGSMLDCLVARVVEGCAAEDLDIETVSPNEMIEAARKYLPFYKGAYVRVTLQGL